MNITRQLHILLVITIALALSACNTTAAFKGTHNAPLLQPSDGYQQAAIIPPVYNVDGHRLSADALADVNKALSDYLTLQGWQIKETIKYDQSYQQARQLLDSSEKHRLDKYKELDNIDRYNGYWDEVYSLMLDTLKQENPNTLIVMPRVGVAIADVNNNTAYWHGNRMPATVQTYEDRFVMVRSTMGAVSLQLTMNRGNDVVFDNKAGIRLIGKFNRTTGQYVEEDGSDITNKEIKKPLAILLKPLS